MTAIAEFAWFLLSRTSTSRTTSSPLRIQLAASAFVPALVIFLPLLTPLHWSLWFVRSVQCPFCFFAPIIISSTFCAFLQLFSPSIIRLFSGFLYWQQCFFSPFGSWHFLIAFLWASFWASAKASRPLHPSFHLVSLPFCNSVRGFCGNA